MVLAYISGGLAVEGLQLVHGSFLILDIAICNMSAGLWAMV